MRTTRSVRQGLTVCQGESSARAEPSEGCQDCSAVASLKRMVGYKSSNSRPNISSHGCSQVCKGILSSLGSHACTARLICMKILSLYTCHLPTWVQPKVWLVPQTLRCDTQDSSSQVFKDFSTFGSTPLSIDPMLQSCDSSACTASETMRMPL